LKHLNKQRGLRDNLKELKKAEIRHNKSTKALAELYKFKGDIKDYFIEPIVFPTIFSPKVEQKGFDIVIGNPPYVNTKLISQMNLTETLKDEYGYCDDLYNHFTVRGMELLKQGGFLT
jgi:Eco57I restriction-modification methylase